jgi:phosphatidylinositol alpha-1,6-mannosyltransferase
MGILVITWNFPPSRGGIEYLMSQLCAGLKKQHSVQVITAHAPASHPAEEGVFRAPCPGLVPFAFYALWRGCGSLFRNPEIKIILGGSVLASPLVLILARLFGRRAVVQAHGLDVVYPNPFYQLLCVRWLKFCDRVVANSTYTASLAAQKGVQTAQIAVIPPGIDLDRFARPVNVDAIKKELRLEKKQIVLFVGRLAKRKGVKEFIEKSFVQIAREIPNVCFLIIGDNPTESLAHRDDTFRDIKAAITETKLQNQIRLLGTLSDDQLVEVYQASDIVVLPALATTDDVEGFGIVLLEAAAAGKPVVATSVGGIPDAMDDGKSGILIGSDDYQGLSQAIISLLRENELRASMGAHGRQHVREKFAWDKVIDQYNAVMARGAITDQ